MAVLFYSTLCGSKEKTPIAGATDNHPLMATTPQRWIPSTSGVVGLWLTRSARLDPGYPSSSPSSLAPEPLLELKKKDTAEARKGAQLKLHGDSLLSGPKGEFLLELSAEIHSDILQEIYLADIKRRPLQVFLDGRRVGAPSANSFQFVHSLLIEKGSHELLIRLKTKRNETEPLIQFVDKNTGLAPAHLFFSYFDTQAEQILGFGSKALEWQFQKSIRGSGYAFSLHLGFPKGRPLLYEAKLRATLNDFFDLHFDVHGDTFLPLKTFDEEESRRLEQKKNQIDLELESGQLKTRFFFEPKTFSREAIKTAERAIAEAENKDHLSEIRQHLRLKLESFISNIERGDSDFVAQNHEARELLELSDAALKNRDPLLDRTGPMRRYYLSPLDDQFQTFGLYVPPDFRSTESKTYPLILALHGLNGRALAMLRHSFGGDDPLRDSEWEERHLLNPWPKLEAFVITPTAYGNAMYRGPGEMDILQLIDWAKKHYPINSSRISITGLSMGGTGAASLAFHHPSLFSAAEPLCGYHSYFVRNDIKGFAWLPWEKSLAKERSNVEWALNGMALPLYVVHGQLDKPVANSDVLISRYKELGYSIRDEHPLLGHQVWQRTYKDLHGLRWLLPFKHDPHLRHIHFRTFRPRFGHSDWMHITSLSEGNNVGEVDAQVLSEKKVKIEAHGVRELSLDRDPILFTSSANLELIVNGKSLIFSPDEELTVFFSPASVSSPKAAFASNSPFAGAADVSTASSGSASKRERKWDFEARKKGNLTGPFGDIYHEPILFVYGSNLPGETLFNYETASYWARYQSGLKTRYRLESDKEFLSRGGFEAERRSIMLVGTLRSNLALGVWQNRMKQSSHVLPIVFGDGELFIDAKTDLMAHVTKRYSGEEIGASYIYPDISSESSAKRYIAVVSGNSLQGVIRSLALPDLLPDYAIYDSNIDGAKGKIIAAQGKGSYISAGFFDEKWGISLP